MEPLVQSAQSGDVAAESELLTQLRARLLALTKYRLQRCLRGISQSELEMDAEDIVQEALIIIQEKYKTVEPERNFFAWVMQILRNCIGNYLQKTIRRGRKVMRMEARAYELFDEGQDVARQLEFRELLQHIEAAIGRLDKVCRKVMRIFFEGGTREDLLKAFKGVPVGTIDNRLHRCRKRLKARLAKQGYVL